MGIRAMAAAVACLVLVATACGTDDGAGEDPTATVTASPTSTVTVTETASPQAAEGGTLTVAISSDPGSLNPAITTSGAVHTASEIFFNGLVGLDEDGAPVPELAEDWEIADDGREYTFTLRDDVTWHDGEPFTAADVVFTFEQALLELHARTQASMGSALASVEAPDDHTVVFRFTEPYAPLLQQLNVTEAPILPEHVYGEGDLEEHPANIAPVGTGPFVFESYTEGSEIRATANEDYFKEGPFLDALVMRIIPDEGTQLLALESGEVDFLWNVPGPDVERLQDDPGFVLESTPSNPGGSNCIMTISFNLDRPIPGDPAVRRAVAHALDRQRFVDQVLFGQGQVAEAPISSGIPWAHAEDVDLPDHDVAEAERLLEEAGWVEGDDGVRMKDGERLAIDFVHFPTFARYAELVREQLGAVGFQVDLVALEPPVFGPTVFGEDDFETNIISYCNGPDPEIGVRRMYDSNLIGDVPFTNAAHYSNPEVDRLFEEASQTVDREDRSPIYAEIQRIVAEDLPYVWVVETVGTRAWNARCEGFQPHTGLFAETARCGDG